MYQVMINSNKNKEVNKLFMVAFTCRHLKPSVGIKHRESLS